MTLETLGPVAVLALIDSTSIGTLVIPVWLMLAPRARAGRIVLYLGTVAAAYFLLGLLILGGIAAVAAPVGDALDSRAGTVVQLLVGLVLLVLGVTVEPWTKAGKERRASRRAERRARRGPTRMESLTESARTGELPLRALLVLAVGAVAVEAASMLPYLAALGLLSAAGVGPVALSVTLAAYCLLMIAPALLLLGLRLALHARLSPALERLANWLTRASREAMAWILFLLGLYLAADAARGLGWIT